MRLYGWVSRNNQIKASDPLSRVPGYKEDLYEAPLARVDRYDLKERLKEALLEYDRQTEELAQVKLTLQSIKDAVRDSRIRDLAFIDDTPIFKKVPYADPLSAFKPN